MKKSLKITIGIGSVLAVAAPAITIPLMMKFETHIFNKSYFEANVKYSKEHNAVKYTSKESDIVKTADEADINIYYAPAVAPFKNLLRLSMLTKSENHFFVIRGSENEGFEDKVDSKALEDFYNNERVGATNKDSKVIDVHGSINSTATDALEKIHGIIDANQDKKINIWWNGYWVEAGHWKDRVLNLAGFSNVNVQTIEDGSSMQHYYAHVRDHIDSGNWDGSAISIKDKFAAPVFIPRGVRSWYSAKEFMTLNSYAQNNEKLFNNFEYKELSDGIFNARDVKGSRLNGHWTVVSGLDWKNEAKKVADAKKLNGKPSLIVLGSYGVDGEEEYIKDVWNRYHDNYNIFYKGHPGHLEHPQFVQKEMLDKHLDSMYQLEPMISSEELTRDHINPDKDGLSIKFDKIIAVGKTSAVTKAAFPNLDITKDVVEVYYGKNDLEKNPSMYPDSTSWTKAEQWITIASK